MKPKEQWFTQIAAPFVDEISGLAIFKMLDEKALSTLMLKLKFVQNFVTLDVTNIPLELVIFNPKNVFLI